MARRAGRSPSGAQRPHPQHYVVLGVVALGQDILECIYSLWFEDYQPEEVVAIQSDA